MKLADLYSNRVERHELLPEIKRLFELARKEPDMFKFVARNMNTSYRAGAGARELAAIWYKANNLPASGPPRLDDDDDILDISGSTNL